MNQRIKIMIILIMSVTIVLNGMFVVSKIRNGSLLFKIFDKQRMNWKWENDWNSLKEKNLKNEKPIINSKKPDEQVKPKVETKGRIVSNSLEDALSKSKEMNRQILVFFTSKSCVHCNHMKMETFKNKDVLSKLENYIFLEVDVNDHPDVRKQFHIIGLPTYKILDSEGNQMKSDMGFLNSKDFINWLN